MLEYVKEYIHTLPVKDKNGYEKRITACVEYLDGIGVTEPTDSNWQSCLESLTVEGRISNNTARTNYIGQAKNFYRWYAEKYTQAPAMTNEIEPDKAETTLSDTERETGEKPSKPVKDKTVRINFMLDEKRYKKLAILSVLENMSLTALLKEGIDLCISAHDKQAAIAEQAVSQSENARSE